MNNSLALTDEFFSSSHPNKFSSSQTYIPRFEALCNNAQPSRAVIQLGKRGTTRHKSTYGHSLMLQMKKMQVAHGLKSSKNPMNECLIYFFLISNEVADTVVLQEEYFVRWVLCHPPVVY